MTEIISAGLMLIGASFLLLAAVGVVRMPDLFTRMQPATKAATLGITCMLLAVAVFFGRIGITTRAIATIVFFFLTAPVTAHLVGRASYFVGVPLWKGTVIDELRGKYDPLTHTCYSAPDPAAVTRRASTAAEADPLPMAGDTPGAAGHGDLSAPRTSSRSRRLEGGDQ